MKPLLAVLFVIALTPAAFCQEVRVFTNAQGVAIRAALISVANGQATIKREDGAQFAVPVTAFSAVDQEYIRQWSAKPAPTSAAAGPNASLDAATLNALAGQSIFDELSLWESPGEGVAERLQLRRESQTSNQSSFRSYPKEDFRVFGARPFSVALYADEGKTTSLSLVFANKGDLFGSKGSAELHFDKDTPPAEAEKIVKKAMDADLKAISETITAKLGAPKRERFGEGKTGRMNMQRWDWRGHSILLAEAEGEYVGLQIVPTAFADAGGKSTRVPDAVIRERSSKNVLKRPNGDVVIQDIPMVDQGPKGYCVPATAERAMRYLGVSADMYILANAGGTGYGGGTSVSKLLEGVGRYIRAKGRSFDTWEGAMSVRDLAKHIDKGIPVIWALSSTKAFNETANRRTDERKTVTEWSEWKKKLAVDTADNVLMPDSESGHVVLIIGYNKETGEIAFSDSWGERFMERWITIKEADLVSQRYYYVVGF
ncbi:peptidase C39-like protein [Prosthecobacter fusiformis]|uniref:Peptidase C39-like protein n=1 Tax=Prosthecobacter fusiformis TaxID=48464 RepID=A0A4R7S1K9_9BACT|nr:C39 family peptidase [Prosthecobacter fusiformis]TDU71298.1 peptidase C39-like protein [Prosthecobacter fusiformis]